MPLESLNHKVVKATKWSAISEIVAKLVMPISNMVLARLLAPEAFGIVTTITMVITFAEVFTDAGFQKYLVQHEFADENDKEQSTNVAFWSNLALSLLFWLVIAIYRDRIAILVGNPGMGIGLFVSSASIPLAAFSSIQTALYKRSLDFKTLFKVRAIGVCIPLFVTIPCAMILENYWALVIGILSRDFINAIVLTWYSSWKPRFFYSILKLKEMISFTFWSLLESISVWLTEYVDIFIVGTMLSQYYLGLYKTSSAVVSQIMGLITAATTPILFSALSRLQNDERGFNTFFFKFQKTIGLIIIPLGVIIFISKDFITDILLGNQWKECAGFVGLWGLTSTVTIVLSHYASEVYRSKGRPKLSVLVQWLHMIVLWPIVFVSVRYGFEVLYVARSLVRLELVLVNVLVLYLTFRISPFLMIRNIFPSLVGAFSMLLVAHFFFSGENGILQNILKIGICGITYLFIITFFKEERSILTRYIKLLRK